MMDKDPQTHTIIGAALEVHRVLGHGFLERAYQDALVIEFLLRNILFHREVDLPISYKGQNLPCGYRADFVCFDSIIVEIKALDNLSGTEEAQVINYLRASGYQRGLLINFGRPSLEFKRLVWQYAG